MISCCVVFDIQQPDFESIKFGVKKTHSSDCRAIQPPNILACILFANITGSSNNNIFKYLPQFAITLFTSNT